MMLSLYITIRDSVVISQYSYVLRLISLKSIRELPLRLSFNTNVFFICHIYLTLFRTHAFVMGLFLSHIPLINIYIVYMENHVCEMMALC